MNSPSAWQVGAAVELRKPHPCGSRAWRVYRVGADIGLRCVSCGRRIMLSRDEADRRLRKVLADA